MPLELERFRYPGRDADGFRTRRGNFGRSFDLIANDSVVSTVQVLAKGQGNRSHQHPDQHGYWLVLSGRVRFYGADDALLDELGEHEGIFVPSRTRYWFENVRDEPAELLRVSVVVRIERARPRPAPAITNED
jgi:mannose-6-phosphate isomerase-like protein (cupin superfamily)